MGSPTYISTNPSFFQQFMQAYQAGQQAKRQREVEEQAAEERKLRLETLKFEQNRIKLEDKLNAAKMNRQGAFDTLKFMEQTPTPRQELPTGIPGPPQPMGQTSLNIPGISLPEAGIDVPGFTAPVNYREDMEAMLSRQREMQAAEEIRKAMGMSEATARGQANVAREPRDVPGIGQVPGDLADNFITQQGDLARLLAGQQFTAQQNDLNRSNSRGNAEIAAGATRENTAATRAVQAEQNLRAEYDKKIAATEGVIQKIEQAKELASAPPSGQNDMALVFTFMKALDEGVVRETEYARAAQIGSMQERAKAALAKLQTGEMLTPAQRSAYVHTLNTIGESVKKQRGVIDQRYAGIAQKKGVDPSLFLSDTSSPSTAVQEGQIVYDPQGRPHRMVNGRPVPVQ